MRRRQGPLSTKTPGHQRRMANCRLRSCTSDKSLPSRCASEGLSASRQRIAKDVASKLTCREPKKPQPPPRSSRTRSSSRRSELPMSQFCRRVLLRSNQRPLPEGQNGGREGMNLQTFEMDRENGYKTCPSSFTTILSGLGMGSDCV